MFCKWEKQKQVLFFSLARLLLGVLLGTFQNAVSLPQLVCWGPWRCQDETEFENLGIIIV
jgi:hypothetical protein